MALLCLPSDTRERSIRKRITIAPRHLGSASADVAKRMDSSDVAGMRMFAWGMRSMPMVVLLRALKTPAPVDMRDSAPRNRDLRDYSSLVAKGLSIRHDAVRSHIGVYRGLSQFQRKKP